MQTLPKLFAATALRNQAALGMETYPLFIAIVAARETSHPCVFNQGDDIKSDNYWSDSR